MNKSAYFLHKIQSKSQFHFSLWSYKIWRCNILNFRDQKYFITYFATFWLFATARHLLPLRSDIDCQGHRLIGMQTVERALHMCWFLCFSLNHYAILCCLNQSKIKKKITRYIIGFPPSSVGKKNCLQCRRPGFDFWVRKIPWSWKWKPTLVFLPG